MKNKAIFLDRDGTINVEKQYLYKIEEWEFLPGVLEALHMFQHHGFKLIVITNQSGIARGKYSESDYYKLTGWMQRYLFSKGIVLDDVFFCPHHPEAKIAEYRQKCQCRKPGIMLFEKAAAMYDISFLRSYAIGDRLRDCSICATTDCRGFLTGTATENSVIEDIINGKVEKIRYADSLLRCAKIICEEEENDG